MKQYKLQTGGNRNIFDVLTIEDSGRMTLTFHGTDRTITHEATTNEDGWIAAGSSLYPPLSCGKWAESPATAKGTRERENEGRKERNIYANLYGDYFQEAQQKEKENQKQMIFAGIATVVVFIILVNFIGIFGLAALGLMAGGIVK